MAVTALVRNGAPVRPRVTSAALPAEGAPEVPPPKPDADGIVRSDAAKAGYKAWLKGRMKAMFEDLIAAATKRRS